MEERIKQYPKLVTGCIFILGLSFILYPFVSQFMHQQASKVVVDEFYEVVEQLPDQEIEERIRLAKAYNSALEPDLQGIHDPYSDEEREGLAEYGRMLEVKEQIGSVNIPNLDLELPVRAGTSEQVLQDSVGHLESTSLPVGGDSTHSVITAHRGLPDARLFTDLDDMEVGDIFYFTNIQGTLAYKVTDISVIEPDDLNAIRIVPGKDLMTLLTCTPYMINTHRLIVTGERIPYEEPVKGNDQGENEVQSVSWWVLLLILSLLILIVWRLYKRQKTSELTT